MLVPPGTPTLLEPSAEVDLDEAIEIVQKLRDVIVKVGREGRKALGMAAPQIGINKRVFVADDAAYINPRIVAIGGKPRLLREGCYSVPDNHSYSIMRQAFVKLEWRDEYGNYLHGMFHGKQAQVIQHEFDHLEGKLISRGLRVR